MQQTQNRISQHDLTDLPTRIMVVGYRYKVDFGPSVKPRVHLLMRTLFKVVIHKPAVGTLSSVKEYVQ